MCVYKYKCTCVLCCFALFVCLTLLASFFLPSHLSFKNMYISAEDKGRYLQCTCRVMNVDFIMSDLSVFSLPPFLYSWIASRSPRHSAPCVTCCGLTHWRTLAKRNRPRRITAITLCADVPTITGAVKWLFRMLAYVVCL